jgi:hypothetical protein
MPYDDVNGTGHPRVGVPQILRSLNVGTHRYKLIRYHVRLSLNDFKCYKFSTFRVESCKRETIVGSMLS